MSTRCVTTEFRVKPSRANSAPYPSANGASGPPAITHDTLPIVFLPPGARRPSRRKDSTRRDYADLIGAVPHEKPTPQGSSSQDRGLVGIIPGSGLVDGQVDLQTLVDAAVDEAQES